jgi:hypothetical protein
MEIFARSTWQLLSLSRCRNLLNEEYHTEDELYVGKEVEIRPPEGCLNTVKTSPLMVC